MPEALAILYAVQNEKKQWFRRKGYGGSGDSWVDEFAKARVYQKIGPARGVVSFFANNYTGFSPPKLVELRVTEIREIDETERVNKQKQKKEIRCRQRDERNRKYQLEQAQKQLEEAQARIKDLQT